MALITKACLLLLIALSLSVSLAAEDTTALGGNVAPKVDVDAELPLMQKTLNKIKSQVAIDANDQRLGELNAQALVLSGRAEAVMQALFSQRQQLIAQLLVLGPAPDSTAGNIKETPDVTRKRMILESQKNRLNGQIQQTLAIKNGAVVVASQIGKLRRDALKNQLALNSGTLLGADFWTPVVKLQQQDRDKIAAFWHELNQAFVQAWQGNRWPGTLMWLAAALLIATAGRRGIEGMLAWICIHKLPEGRLRRSFFAVAVVLSTLLSLVLTFSFIEHAFARQAEVTDEVRLFLQRLVQLSVFCSLIAGLGRAFLSNRRPSWRLAPLSDALALALKPFPPLTAALVFIFQTLELFNSSLETSPGITIFANGMTALLIGTTALAISLHSNRIRRNMRLRGQPPEKRSTLAGLIQLALFLTGMAILVSLLSGYITLGRFLSYELIWLGIVFGAFYVLNQFVSDLCQSLFSPTSHTGKRLQLSLNIEDRHVKQMAILLSALGKICLMVLAFLAVLNGTLGRFTPLDLLQKAVSFWGGHGLSGFNLVPKHIIHALLCLVIGIWGLRAVRRWLDSDFLPQTTMDKGMRASLVTLFGNLGYVLVILLTLFVLGVQWNKLAWIVSALSVGIGFGLQEIVKNFISGLILLTERPVKVGDLISISGIEGDIRRINVRATEIQLSDKSTVVVPNSQLISQNVRNATMGNAPGVVTIVLTFPLDIDPARVRELLLSVYRQNERILSTPEPSVTFRDLTPQGIVMSVTGNVASQRLTGSVKSDLLFTLLMRLREEGVMLSIPQMMVIKSQHLPPDVQKNGVVTE